MTQLTASTIIVVALIGVLAYFLFNAIASHFSRKLVGLWKLIAIVIVITCMIIALFGPK